MSVKEKIKTVRDNIEQANKSSKILQWEAEEDWSSFGDVFAIYAGKVTEGSRVLGKIKDKSTAQLVAQVGRMGIYLCDEIDKLLSGRDLIREELVVLRESLTKKGDIKKIDEIIEMASK